MARHWSAPSLFSLFGLLLALMFQPAPARAFSGEDAAPQQKQGQIPAPRSVLGFNPGDDRTIADWQQIGDYFARLDAASDRVLVQTIGQTTLGRPLIVAFISAPENIRNLAKLKEIQRRLADPRTIETESERGRLIRDGKTVVAISCSIHSTEIVASQMSMQLAYELATAGDAETREILENTILLLLPSANPDGVDVVARWYRKTLGTPYEGKAPPELYHHYAGHDNNRDWFMLNLKETQAVTRLFWKEWFPEIVYDIHQMGITDARLFVPPFYDPANPSIPPLLLRQVGLIGHKIAADLQAAGFRGVITNAMYDTWWHGGFRTAPYYHNSVGILSEAASARLMTPANVTRAQLAKSTTRGMTSALRAATNFPAPWPGGAWRPRDIMSMELLAARSVLSLAAKYRTSYLQNFTRLASANLESKAEARRPIAYLIPAGQGNDEAVARIIGVLVEQGVEVHRLERELHGESGVEAIANTTRTSAAAGNDPPVEAEGATLGIKPVAQQEIPAGSYLVFLAQPTRANVQALFEPQIYPQRLGADGQAERPYDVAGWTLPLQMGVETLAVTSLREPPAERRLTLIRGEAEVRRDLGLAQRSGQASPIPNPVKGPARLGLYSGWTANMDEGWTRFVLDTFNVPYESLRDTDVRRGDLRARYDVIILPSQRAREIVEGNAPGSYPAEFTGGITEAGVEHLRSFVADGGTLVCFDASSDFAIKRLNLPLRNALEGVSSAEFYCPGSILGLEVDARHPLARGMAREANAYFINGSAFTATDPQRVRVVARYAARNLLRSGWLLGEERIQGKIALAEVSLGKGRVILFGFRPQHRGQTWATFPFIFNAISKS